MINNQLIDEFGNLKRVHGEDSPHLIQTKEELDILLKHNCKTPLCLHDILCPDDMSIKNYTFCFNI